MAFATLGATYLTHVASLLNLVRSVGASVGIWVVTTLLGANTQRRHEDLVAHITSSSIALIDPSTSDRLGSRGGAAMAMLNAELYRMAALLPNIDHLLAMICVQMIRSVDASYGSESVGTG